MTKQTILWDMDGCLARFTKAVTDHLNIQFIDLRWTEDDIKTWNFWEKVPDKHVAAQAFAFFNSPGFFRNLEAYEESVNAFLEMFSLGHDVKICSSPLRTDFERIRQEKYDWLVEHLGAEHADRAIFVGDKSEVPADVIIDDHPRLTVRKKDYLFKNWLIVGHAYNEVLSDELTMLPVGRIKNDWSNWREEFSKLDLI